MATSGLGQREKSRGSRTDEGKMALKVCIIGQVTGARDEGMKNTNLHLIEELEKRVKLLVVDPAECYSYQGWRKIRQFRPAIIHYLHGPTIRSLVLCRMLRMAFPGARVVLLASNPLLKEYWYSLLPLLAPHHVFAVTKRFHERMSGLGISSRIVYPGVDQARFVPVKEDEKIEIRRKLNLPVDRKIVLHVGHCTEARGVLPLGLLQQQLSPAIQFVVVSSSTNAPRESIREQLRDQGVLILDDFIPNIEMVYQAADLYLFPGVRPDAAIDIPLSVFEAMAVNLPVVTTRFGGLPDLFEPSPWFRFADSPDGMFEEIKTVLAGNDSRSETRKMISPYTWNGFIDVIQNDYEMLLGRAG